MGFVANLRPTWATVSNTMPEKGGLFAHLAVKAVVLLSWCVADTVILVD